MIGTLTLLFALAIALAGLFNLVCYLKVARDCPGWGSGILALLALISVTLGCYFVIIWCVMYADYSVSMWLRSGVRFWTLMLLAGATLLQSWLLVVRPRAMTRKEARKWTPH
jgi:hypothetical protein